jgi:hypothetical protein
LVMYYLRRFSDELGDIVAIVRIIFVAQIYLNRNVLYLDVVAWSP